jgi:methyltransferase, FkbM family
MNEGAEIPDYESMLERFYRGLLSRGDTCVDIGAHIGRHTYPMLECVGAGGRILAFEPIPDLAQALRMQVESRGLSKTISIHQLALADEAGAAAFYIAVDAPGYSGLRRRVYDVPTSVREIEVQLRTLDDMVDGVIDSLNYIKIDAEGAEWSILRGARKALERFRPVVSFEFGEASYGVFGVDPEEVHQFFLELDYLVYDLRGRLLDRHAFAASSRHQELWDYIAIPRERDQVSTLAPLIMRVVA